MIPFNKPYMTGRELGYIERAHANHMLAGDGPFTRTCHEWLEHETGARRALLTHSCTAALEMAAILSEAGPGDEVIMPSFTFVATANAFVLRGATPVFVDIWADTLNLDESKVEAAVTPRTRAIVPIHYAGIACAMDGIMDIADRRGLLVVEDAAQGLMARHRGRPLGSIGHMAALSFHETKNVQSGEGGALLLNDERFVERAEIVREKGTDRSRFFRGQVDKYTWMDIGSSFLPGEIIAAFLAAQLEEAAEITRRRIAIWERYHAAFAELESAGLLRRPVVPPDCTHNGHIYYVLLPSLAARTAFMQALNRRGISTVFHYVPLHSSPGGRRFGRASGDLAVTDDLSSRLVRLPLWVGFEEYQEQVIASIVEVLRG